LDYKNLQIANGDSIIQFLESIPKIPTQSEANIIVKTCCLLKQLISKQNIKVPALVSFKLSNWIMECLSKSLDSVCEALNVLTLLFKKDPEAANQVSHLLFCSESSNNQLQSF